MRLPPHLLHLHFLSLHLAPELPLPLPSVVIHPELSVVIDPVQNVAEVSTDISKVVTSPVFHPFGKGLVLFFILGVQYLL